MVNVNERIFIAPGLEIVRDFDPGAARPFHVVVKCTRRLNWREALAAVLWPVESLEYAALTREEAEEAGKALWLSAGKD